MPEPSARPTFPARVLALPASAASYARRSQCGWYLSGASRASSFRRSEGIVGLVDEPSIPHHSERGRLGTSMAIASTSIDNTDWLVAELQQLARARALQYTLEVGKLVVTHVFGGLDELHDRGRGDVSYRRLAQREDLPFSAVTLWRCVKIYELVERFPSLLGKQHLALAHLRAVVTLPPAAQQELLDQAEENSWTSEDLVRAARRRRDDTTSGSRQSSLALARCARRLRQLAADLQTELDAAPAALRERLPPHTRSAVANLTHDFARVESCLTDQGKSAHRKARPASGTHRVVSGRSDPHHKTR
jgi:hypothetical protein